MHIPHGFARALSVSVRDKQTGHNRRTAHRERGKARRGERDRRGARTPMGGNSAGGAPQGRREESGERAAGRPNRKPRKSRESRNGQSVSAHVQARAAGAKEERGRLRAARGEGAQAGREERAAARKRGAPPRPPQIILSAHHCDGHQTSGAMIHTACPDRTSRVEIAGGSDMPQRNETRAPRERLSE